MTHEELQAAYDKLLQENRRLKRLAEDAREKLDAAMDGTGLCIWQNHVPTGKLIIFNRRWGSSISPASEHGQMGCGPITLTARMTTWLRGETVTPPVWLALGLLCVGVVLASLPARRVSATLPAAQQATAQTAVE